MMEINDISPNTDDFYSYYTSEPTSPRIYNLDGYFFLSMPTSPTRDPSGFEFESRNLDPTRDFPNLVDNNFEFEGSKRFYSYDNGFEKSYDNSLSYADELFSDGKMVPLRPPPRAQYPRSERKSGNSSTASSPGTRTSTVKVPFLRQRSLWNDGYDPFATALDKVKEENEVVRNKLEMGQLRRAKSLSPLRLASGSSRLANTNNHKKFGPSPDAWVNNNKSCPNPSKKDVFGQMLKPNESVRKSESTECRKQRIKKFLLKNAAAFGKAEKKEQSAPLLFRKLHYSVRFKSVTPKTIIRFSREMKSLMKHRARIFLCLAKGFGTKCSRKLS